MSKSELKRIKSQTDFNSIEILEAHQKWRRGADIEMQSPYLLGLAIDEAIIAFKLLAEVKYKLQEEMDFTEQLKNIIIELRNGNPDAISAIRKLKP